MGFYVAKLTNYEKTQFWVQFYEFLGLCLGAPKRPKMTKTENSGSAIHFLCYSSFQNIY